MKNACWPCCNWWLAMAAAMWVLPHPLGPLRTSHPQGSRAKSSAAWQQWVNLSWFAESPVRPWGRRFSKVSLVSGPRLLKRSSRPRCPCSNSFSVHEHGSSLPKSACP